MSPYRALTRREAESVLTASVLNRDEVQGFAVYADTVRVFGPGCKWPDAHAVPDNFTALYLKPGVSDLPPSRTQRALALLDTDPTLSRWRAAQLAGVHYSAVIRALQRRARAALKASSVATPD